MSLLIPFRDPDGAGWRTRVRDWQQRWLTRVMPGTQLVHADDGMSSGPFSLARAVNRAAARADGDVWWIMGCDHAPLAEQLAGVEERFAAGAPWCTPFTQTRCLSRPSTELVLQAGADPWRESPEVTLPFAVGPTAVRADVFTEAGGMDERFVGWGFEDAAFRAALSTFCGQPAPPVGPLVTLWHPEVPRRELTSANLARFSDVYQPAAGNPTRMRQVVAAHVAARTIDEEVPARAVTR